jgi:hypothetical protein
VTQTRPAHRGDPAESWELPWSESEGGSFFRGVCDVFPCVPRRAEDIAGGALDALIECCSLEGLRQVFMIPRSARLTGCGDEKVISPHGVLGIGTRAVGLWTGEPGPGVKAVIPIERLAAIEDVTILLYGRLSFISASGRLTIRYNTLARSGLEPALLELRQRLAGPPETLPIELSVAQELPVKWKRLLHSPLLGFHEDAPVTFRFAHAPRASRQDVDRGQILVVNPHEMIYMCDPPEASHTYGADSVIVPRPRITRVRDREKYLEVASNGARLSLEMVSELRRAGARWFA